MSSAETVILVEGESDRQAVLGVASRLGRELSAEGVEVVAMGGASGFGDYLIHAVAAGKTVAGMCDEGEAGDLRRGLEESGFGPRLSLRQMELLGFFICVRDLEEEMIRAIGGDGVVGVIEAEGETGPFEKFRRQPEWRDRALEQQLRRFIGTRAGRKVRFGGLLVEAMDLDRVPKPLKGVLDAV